MGRIVQGSRIVRAEVVEALVSAEERVVNAKKKATELVVEAKAECEEIRAEARRQGREDAQSEVAALFAAAHLRREQLLAGVQDEIVDLALEVARKVIRKEVETRPEIIIELCREALNQLVLADAIILRVNPQDVGIVAEKRQLFEIGLATNTSLRIISDEDIERGGCIVESDMGRLDGRLETQLEAIYKALKAEDG